MELVQEIRGEFYRAIRDCPDLMELLSKALTLDEQVRALLENESVLTNEEREVLKKWQSKLNH